MTETTSAANKAKTTKHAASSFAMPDYGMPKFEMPKSGLPNTEQFEVVSGQNSELCALTQEMATEAAEAIKTGLSKGFNNAS